MALKDSIANITEELGVINKRMRKLRKSQSADNSMEVPSNQSNELENECRALISNSTSLFNTVNILLRRLFTEEEILAHSVSGKAPNSKTAPKPKFDGVKLDLLRSLAFEAHKEATSLLITTKIQAVQKAVRRESST